MAGGIEGDDMGILAESVDSLSFDCYGTLIDWESGIVTALGPWSDRSGLGTDREDLLKRFGAVETIVQREMPGLRYPLVLAETMRRLTLDAGIPATAAEVEAFEGSVPDWPAFPDSAEALARLKTRYKLAILSNVHREGFAASASKLGVNFDLVITAEDVRSYKPDDRNFETLFARLPSIGSDRSRLVHVAESLYHDHGPAQRFDLPSVWIYRRMGKEGSGATHPPTGMREPDLVYPTLAAFADAVLEVEMHG
jgi:2-haloacid dehalogenase